MQVFRRPFGFYLYKLSGDEKVTQDFEPCRSIGQFFLRFDEFLIICLTMKIPGILILVVVTVSCGSISYSTRPSQRVKEFVNLAVKQDYAGMRQMMPQGDEAEATLRGDSDLLLYAGTEGVKATEIEKETIAEPKATVDANITFSNAAQPLVYRFDLQKAGENWVVVRWERLTNSR